MSQNAKALLLASTLILVSAVGVMYLNTERAAATKQATVTFERSVTKRAVARASASVYGLPARVAPISMPGHVSPAEPPPQPGFSNAVKDTPIGGDVGVGASAIISELTHKIGAQASWHND